MASIKMDKDFFLPSEVMINILSKLPVHMVLRTKCVFKSWPNLIKSPEFVKRHIQNSTPGLLACVLDTVRFVLFELNDDLEVERH